MPFIDTQQDGWTALMVASMNGHLPVAQLLIDKGAIIDAQKKVCHLVLCVHLYSRVAPEVVCVSMCVGMCPWLCRLKHFKPEYQINPTSRNTVLHVW